MIKQLTYTFIISLALFLLWTFTPLKNHCFILPFTRVMEDGRYIIITVFVFISFAITLFKNRETQFKDKRSLRIMLGSTGVLFLWLLVNYYFRLVSYFIDQLFNTFFPPGQDEEYLLKRETIKIPEWIDFVFYTFIAATLIFIIYLSRRLRKLNKAINGIEVEKTNSQV